MTTAHPELHSQKLVRCHIRNPQSETSIRFVELENFRLWEYMMRHKHGLVAEAVSLCLWVNLKEYHRKENIYARAGDVHTLNSIVLNIFDPLNGYSHVIKRYALAADTERLKTTLLSHISVDVRESDRFDVTVYPGFGVARSDVDDQQLILGLADQ
ncbi:MAG: hypothetical protein SVU69_06030 [Pseudomonadota bacterium]|nr:hypothetical protein [Pseudomonadota bacterium]